ncbi:MAG TPA: dihydropyrimidinase [Victivallales bacterium]|nr:dihydropyrimidinase [Victivallales bacterium]
MIRIFKNGLIVTAQKTFKGDVVVKDDKIYSVGADASEEYNNTSAEVIDVSGKYILPGVIDPHTHLSMPFMGTESQDDFISGSIAAACGGVTSIIDFDIQRKGESILQALDRKKKIAEGKSCIDYSFHPAITDLTTDVLNEIKTAVENYGTPSFKVFMIYDFRVDDLDLLNLLDKVRDIGGIIQVHAENYFMIEFMNKKLESAGKFEPYYHAVSRPNIVEQEAISRAIKLTEFTDSRIYIVHVSSKEGIEEITEARKRGLEIYAETCPQYLFLSEERYKESDWNGAKYVMSPPLRTVESSNALWKAINSGNIQTIGSDHCPFSFKGIKDMFGKNDYRKIPNGIPGIENSLMLLHSEGVLKSKITLEKMVEILSTNVAEIFGMVNKGSITVGKDADIIIFDPNIEFEISNKNMHMNVDYTPYEGFKVTGMPRQVFVRGLKTAEWNGKMMEFTGKSGSGKFIKRSIK